MSLTASAFMALALQCAPAVAPPTLSAVVKTESDLNPYAIGVVGRSLPRQPQSLGEALQAVEQLVKEGASFSVGLGQIHRQHFNAADPATVAKVFEPCENLKRTAANLQDCYARALDVDPQPQGALRKAVSCYYSGNFTRGFAAENAFGGTSHVNRVLANADLPAVPALQASETAPATAPAPTAPTPTVQPTYESWDVLRQYPRYLPPAPSTPNQQPQDSTPKIEDLPDVQKAL